MNERDRVRLQHMLDAAQEARAFVTGRTRDDLDTDRQLAMAVNHAIAIIGEAAARVSPELQAISPQIEWAAIISTRNQLIHAYFDVDLGIIWDIVTNDLPPLIKKLETFLSSDQS